LGHIEAQGFLFSRPVPADAIPALLERFGVCGTTRHAHASDVDNSDAASTSTSNESA
jgi:hypothetical protein